MLASWFLRSAARFPRRPAVDIGGSTITYAALHRRARGIAVALARQSPTVPRLTAVLGGRTLEAYGAILGVLLHGHGYVPLNPRYPAGRNREILTRARCRTLVVDPTCVGLVSAIVSDMADPPEVLLAGEPDAVDEQRTVQSGPEDPAYLLFTSGSTGRPKGVLVSQRNVTAFLAVASRRYQLSESDRFSQLFDLTFDLSVFDLFAAWGCGGCVCPPDDSARFEPSRFVREAELTVWFSVPSVALLMKRLGALKPDVFRSLRLSLFCGEALPADLASAWAAAAPASVVENLYGPTEATIACTAHRWDASGASSTNGLVPIGRPFGEMKALVVDEALRQVTPGQPGQLLLAGPQVVSAYFDDEKATKAAFVEHEELGHGYLTGDRVLQQGVGAPLEFLGRMDTQIKVLGHRVELGEVEAALRDETGAHAVAVGWPRTESGAAGLVAFVDDASLDPVAVRQALAARLPDYMIPRELRLVDALPLNTNGKHDRKALLSLLEAE
jgi:amino acid adenylation domain-containing protein